MCVTGMTSTGSACPSQGGREQRWCTEESAATGDQCGILPRMLILSPYPPCIPFTLSPCLPRHPGDCCGGSGARCLCAHTAAQGCKWKMLFSSQHSPHTMVPSTPIHSLVLGVGNYPCGAGVQESSCSSDTSSYLLHHTSVANFPLLSHPFLRGSLQFVQQNFSSPSAITS